MSTVLFSLIIMLVHFLITSCALSSKLKPGTGDIAFRLHWEGTADLDLHVVDPPGDEIYYHARRSESGGLLDVDCNRSPDSLCTDPVENIYWPVGNAPPGLYKYWVELFHERDQTLPIQCRVEVLLAKDIIDRQDGDLQKRRDIFGPFTTIYSPTGVKKNLP